MEQNYFRVLPIAFYRPSPSISGPASNDQTGNAGWDLHATEDVLIQPGEIIRVPVNMQAAIPTGYYGLVTPRSGLSSEGLNIIAGTIDSNYRGQISAIAQNFTGKPFQVEEGMRIAQLIVLKHEIVKWEEVSSPEELGETKRGDKGFGKSGLF